jgi:hypothetical protein
LLFGLFGKIRNDFCLQRIGWRGMEMLLCRIVGLLLRWMALCLADKKGFMKEYIHKINLATSKILWLPLSPTKPLPKDTEKQ